MFFKASGNSQRPSIVRRSVQRRSRNDDSPTFVIAVDFGYSRDFTTSSCFNELSVKMVGCPNNLPNITSGT